MIRLLGIFEDDAQREFHLGVVESAARRSGLAVEMDPQSTKGCRPRVLAKFLEVARDYTGVIVGVDGGRRSVGGKRTALDRAVGLERHSVPLLVSVAIPSIEEWMMADEEAMRRTLAVKLSVGRVPAAPRPGRAEAERTAKNRLREWTTMPAGERLLDDGREYARDIGRSIDLHRIGSSRNRDLHDLLHQELPSFLERLRRAS